jgi:hypothetical protein
MSERKHKEMQNPKLMFMATQTCTLYDNADKLGPYNLSLYFFFKIITDSSSYHINFI